MNTRTANALALAFKIAAMGLAGATISLAVLGAGDAATYAVILAIGLFSLAIGSVMHQQQLRRGDERRP
jgi:hypothetical protein